MGLAAGGRGQVTGVQVCVCDGVGVVLLICLDKTSRRVKSWYWNHWNGNWTGNGDNWIRSRSWNRD